MKKMLMFAVVAAALAVSMSAMAGGTLQPVDLTADQLEWPSEAHPSTFFPPAVDWLIADDWKCDDGQPIIVVKWWGTYHPYKTDVTGPVEPPAFQPTGFILTQYADNAGAPGATLNEVVMPIADCNQAYAGTATITGPFYSHVFGYQVTLPAPWTQTKDSIYWLSVQAQFTRDPDITTDGFVHWGWVSTPPGSFEGRGQQSNDGGDIWTPVELNPGDIINFAFEIGALPVGTEPNKTLFLQSDTISVTADVAATSTPCFPFVRILMPDNSVLYLEQTRGFVAGVTPYLGIAAGPIALPKIDDFPILQNARFENMPKGTYYLESGAVDPVTTDINNLQYIGIVDSTALVIQ